MMPVFVVREIGQVSMVAFLAMNAMKKGALVLCGGKIIRVIFSRLLKRPGVYNWENDLKNFVFELCECRP